MNFVKSLHKPLLGLTRHDAVTGIDATGGIHFWAMNGGGKTSSAKMLAGAFLRAGYGGYVTVAKPGVMAEWRDWADLHGRSNSLVFLDENEGFNFLEYEMGRHGFDGIGTVAESLMSVVDAARRASSTVSHRGGDAFWEDSSRVSLRYALPIIYSAMGAITIPDLLRFITTAPTSFEQAASLQWQQSSFMFGTLKLAAQRPKLRLPDSELRKLVNYWREQWVAIPEKTRGNVVATVVAALDRFNHGRLNRFFCDKTTVCPEMSLHGAVLVDAKPTLTWNQDGVIAQQLFKFFWQRSVLTRNSLDEIHRERPVFLWSDESQETVAPYDGQFVGLARDSKCCTVFLTQSLPAYFAKIGGDNPREAALDLAGKFKTHVFGANACPETNEFASRVIGKVLTRRSNFSSAHSETFNEGLSAGNSENSGSSSGYGSSAGSQGKGLTSNHNSGSNKGTGNNWGSNRGHGSSDNTSQGYTESMEYAIEPGEFARSLKTGGPENGNRVTSVWFQAGREFKASGKNYLVTEFKQ